MLSNQWLQNKFFIQWRLFPSEEDNLYWEKFIQDNPHFQNEIEEAIRILKSIKWILKYFLQKRNRKYLH